MIAAQLLTINSAKRVHAEMFWFEGSLPLSLAAMSRSAIYSSASKASAILTSSLT